jgi:hypothetical protein
MPAGVPSTHRTPCSLTAAGQPIRFAEAAISLNRLSCRQETSRPKPQYRQGKVIYFAWHKDVVKGLVGRWHRKAL